MDPLPKSIKFTLEIRLETIVWQDGTVSSMPADSAAVPHNAEVDGHERNGNEIGLGEMYTISPETQPPRTGSTNRDVWDRARQLPQPFTRSQFEAVVGPAMRYDPASGKFGIPTRFPNLRRASQQYFAEFRKRRWIVKVILTNSESEEGPKGT